MGKSRKLKFSIYNLLITVSKGTVVVKDSYKVKDRGTIVKVLNMIKEYVEDYGEGVSTVFDHRSIKSLAREWVAHNNLYSLGYKEKETGSVDFNYPQQWYISIVYWLLSLIQL